MSLAADQFRSGRFDAIEMKLNFALDHLSLAAENPLHVRRYWTRLEAVLGGVRRKPIRLCAPDHVLAGQARNVRARSANVFPLQNSGAVTSLGQVPCHVLAVATADNKESRNALSQTLFFVSLGGQDWPPYRDWREHASRRRGRNRQYAYVISSEKRQRPAFARFVLVSSSSASPKLGRYRPKFNSKSLRIP